jgi:phosphoribosylformylglycinamidine synthase PurS subunit
MKYKASVHIMPLKELLDPQGKAVMSGLQQLGINSIMDVREGKQVILEIEAAGEEQAMQIANDASRKLLANPVMEVFDISLSLS